MLKLKSLALIALLLLFSPMTYALTLTFSVPAHLPDLPSTTTAYLTTFNSTRRALITRANTFVFPNLSLPVFSKSLKTTYLLDVVSRDYDFASYGVDVTSAADGGGGAPATAAEVYRVGRGGLDLGGERVKVVEGQAGPVLEVRVLRTREYYEARTGCECLSNLSFLLTNCH